MKYVAIKVSNTLPHSLRLHHLNQTASAKALRVKALWLCAGSRLGRRKHAVRAM